MSMRPEASEGAGFDEVSGARESARRFDKEKSTELSLRAYCSDGVDYLDQTALRYRVFKEIWAARTLLLPAELTPRVENEEFYGLRAT